MMGFIPDGMGGDAARVLVMVLGHTLWQALLALVLLWVVLRRLPAARVQARYAACMGAMAAVVLGAGVTASVLTLDPAGARGEDVQNELMSLASTGSGEAEPGMGINGGGVKEGAVNMRGGDGGLAPDMTMGAASESPVEVATGETWRDSLTEWLAVGWCIGALLMLARLFTSVRAAARLGKSGEPVTDSAILQMLNDLGSRIGITQSVRLRVSSEVTGPVVLGALRPVILLPASLLLGLPPEVLRAALAHELAHIRRHDYLVNLGQMVVESLLFFNPCVWWISRQMKLEREACCDLLAAEVTGSPTAYAAALAEVASERAEHVPSGASEVALNMAPRPAGSLLNRMRRLLVPGSSLHLRLPWYSLLATVLVWLALLAGLWGGSMAGVALAQKILTPAERIELLRDKEQQFGVPPSQQLGSEDEQTTVSGTVRLADGSLASERLQIIARVSNPRRHNHIELDTVGGFFEEQIECGHMHLELMHPGHAPLLAGPYTLEPEKPLTGLEFQLTSGYPAQIIITDEEDDPLPGVKVVLNYQLPEESNMATTLLESDAAGIVRIDHASTYPATLKAEADGYEPAELEVKKLPKGEPLRWKLRRALLTKGVVLDAGTSQPIANAVLKMAAARGVYPTVRSIGSLTTTTVTDADGNFVLNQLRDDTEYDFLVEAPPHRPTWLTNVRAGQSGIKAVMGEPLIISGVVTGSPEKCIIYDYNLRRRIHGITVSDIIWYPEGNHTQERNHLVPLAIRDGVGHFSVGGLFAGNIRVRWDGGTPKGLKLNVTDSVKGLELSTNSNEGTGTEWARREPAEDVATRTVVLRFQVPPGEPAPAGTMFLNYSGLPGDSNSAKHEPIPITGQEMRFVVAPPTGFSYNPTGTLGYWFEDGGAQVPEGEDEFIHEIKCHSAGSITGTVTDEQGRPIHDAHASVYKREVHQASGKKHTIAQQGITINNMGRFHITPLPLSESYQVVVSRGNNIFVSEELTLRAATPIKLIEAQLVKGVDFEGEVVDKAGTPVHAIPVQLSLTIEPVTHVSAEQLTDRAGKFLLQDLNPEISGYRLKLQIRRDYQPMGVILESGQRFARIVLKEGKTISGRVIDEHGKPVEGATVFALPTWLQGSDYQDHITILAEEASDAQGRFKFSNLPDGEFIFRVRGLGSINDPIGKAGSPEPVEVKLRALPPGVRLDM